MVKLSIMNRFMILCAITINISALIVASLYIKFGIIDANPIRIYIKWIPAALFLIQSIVLTIYHTRKCDVNASKICAYLIFCYACCISGDIFLELDKFYFFLAGMLMFFIFYIFYGTSRVKYIVNFYGNWYLAYIPFCHPLKIAGLAAWLIINAAAFAYAIIQIQKNNTYNHPLFLFAVSIYFVAILYATAVHLLNIFVTCNKKNTLALIGIIIFAVSDLLVLLQEVKFVSIITEIVAISLYWFALMIIGWSSYLCEQEFYYLPQ